MGKGIRNIDFSVDDARLTHFGGLYLFQQFCRKMGLKWLLGRQIRWQRRDNYYLAAELILTIIYAMVVGMKRISDTRILPYNGYFQSLLGIDRFPDGSTLRKFLKGLNCSELKGIIRLHDLLRKKMWNLPHPPNSLIFDLDSTVLPVFGWKIQGAKVGYNPQKLGRPSYHPLICFEGHTRDIWHGLLRPGNTHPVTAAQSLWSAVQEKIPKYIYRIRVRADSGFFDHKFIEILDEKRVGYVVVGKMSEPIQGRVCGLRYHTFRKNGWQAASFTYQPWNWKKSHRFIVIRHPKPQEEEGIEKQLTLWEFKNYFYHTFVTNLSLKPEDVWHFYRPRARCELDIRELKESFPLGSIPTNSFLANQVHFHLILLAYDLVNWFKRLCLPERWHSATLQTIRTDLLVIPARLVNSGGKNQLRLPKGYPYKIFFQPILSKIKQLKIL